MSNNRVSEEAIKEKIINIEIVKCVTFSGQILRWAVLTMENGFAITGEPSCSVDSANDDPKIGEEIAIKNAMNRAWELEGYLLKDKLFKQKQRKTIIDKFKSAFKQKPKTQKKKGKK